MAFSSLKQKINIKYFMAAYLGALLIFSAVYLQRPLNLVAALIIVVLYSFFDLLRTYAKSRTWYLPVSSWISALILGLVAIPDLNVWSLVLLPLLAAVSKQFLHFGKKRHVFNPAGFAMAVSGLFMPVVSWWAVSWGSVPLIVAGLVGLFIVWRQERWHVVLPFLASFAFFHLVHFLAIGMEFPDLLSSLGTLLFDGTLFFFATVMLIEPVTSNFPQRRHRIIYGIMAGFFSALTAYIIGLTGFANLDPLITGLLLGNFTASMLWLK